MEAKEDRRLDDDIYCTRRNSFLPHCIIGIPSILPFMILVVARHTLRLATNMWADNNKKDYIECKVYIVECLSSSLLDGTFSVVSVICYPHKLG